MSFLPKLNLIRYFQARFEQRKLHGRVYESGRVTVTKAGEEPQSQQQEPPESAP